MLGVQSCSNAEIEKKNIHTFCIFMYTYDTIYLILKYFNDKWHWYETYFCCCLDVDKYNNYENFLMLKIVLYEEGIMCECAGTSMHT